MENQLTFEYKEGISPFLISTFVFTCLLFFVDEGYYSFTWMTSFSHWIVFAVYALPILIIQLLLFVVFKAIIRSDRVVLLLSIGLGLFLGTKLVWYLLR